MTWTKEPARERREKRRAEAAQRQAWHDATPAYDKLAKLSARPGESARERKRIFAAVGG